MTKFLFMVVILNLLCKIDARSANQYENLVEVPFGDTVTLECESNVENYTFFYWFLNDRSIIIGPSSDEYNYNSGKFRYEVLSGNLTVKDVSKAEEGVYNCVSRGVIKDDVNIRSVRMLVQTSWEEVYEHDPSVNLFRVAMVLTTLTVMSGVGYAGYRLWKSRFRHPSYLTPSEDDDDSGDELFRAPGTSHGEDNTSIIKTNSTESFETPGISTDFTSILDARTTK